MNPKVDEFFDNLTKWEEEMELLRVLVLECGLTEELKWRVPCYTFQQANVVLIHGFKEYCALNFFKGALIQDTDKLLTQQTENVQSGRQIRFVSKQEIVEKEAILKTYIYQAIEVERAGLKVDMKKTEDFDTPEEFRKAMEGDQNLKSAFEALTPGRQRAYKLYFAGAKQSKTRETRIAKYTPRILKGIGLNDCVCGLSKKMPSCDGSHKSLAVDPR
ncbi:hypothetical protein BFP72_08865 [Reichenbachiella sp. 5M10]|uniref:DUF1801 domain-containing protein n=1 Tax=Reichenbachiella sp. 5M10 TaxID=1889772 RepID=UPI000C14E9CE|nr:DUF1801 domain-containing protein [Reichenbachiella sp. 5M10]PIB35494.1 hypothetical protein BFP72_08865 [Reichenbachiella sp. 5M10]